MGVKPFFFNFQTGKPATFLFEKLCSGNLGIDREKTVILGDSLSSDVGFAKSKYSRLIRSMNSDAKTM